MAICCVSCHSTYALGKMVLRRNVITFAGSSRTARSCAMADKMHSGARGNLSCPVIENVASKTTCQSINQALHERYLPIRRERYVAD